MIEVPQRVKDALKKGTYRKNWRMIVLEEDGSEAFTIDNNNLIKDSIKLDERMCSGDELKFGLCEGSSLEFQFFGHPNIKGRKIRAMLDIQYKEADGSLAWYAMPMGFFDVDQCPRQFDTGIMKVTAFNKLRSKYLDAEAKADVEKMIEEGESGLKNAISLHTLLNQLLENYSVITKDYSEIGVSTAGISSYNYVTLARCNSAGTLDGSYFHFLMRNQAFAVSQDDFWKFKIYADQIREKVKDLVWGITPNQYVMTINGAMTYEKLSQTDIFEARVLNGYFGVRYVDDPSVYGQTLLHDYTTKEYTNLLWVDIALPMFDVLDSNYDRSVSNSDIQRADSLYDNNWKDFHFFDAFKLLLSDIEKMRLTETEMSNIPNVTLRDLQSAVYETNCQFGQLDRETDLFSGVYLNNERLFPSDTLYPRDDLFPTSSAERANASIYEKLWTDEGSQKKFKDLIITYKGINDKGEAVDKTLQRQVNADGNVNYNMSDNWLFRNLLWSSESVGAYADAMVEKMRAISWIPFEMWSVGLPYLETGDELEIKTKEGTALSYILTRQLTGIHDLMDTYTNGELDIF